MARRTQLPVLSAVGCSHGGEQSAGGPEAPAVRRRDAQQAGQKRLLTVSDRKTVARCAADRNRTPASATA
ncbi:hypothetical protein ACFWOB_23945 [Streptomyces sp. NPDC058420]|uniref:hypothetical protein n=1 Tax=Streptomyces sp. NPDC058420 TaxID=3346489 RepID=UPI0036554D3E